jgi:hypothetical protein
MMLESEELLNSLGAPWLTGLAMNAGMKAMLKREKRALVVRIVVGVLVF